MFHTHKHYHNIAAFSLSIIVLGASFGAAGGLSGKTIFDNADASSATDYALLQEEKHILEVAKRRQAFRKRIEARQRKRIGYSAKQEIKTTYPMQSNLLHKRSPVEELEITFGYAELSIPSLNIRAQVNRPSATYFNTGNWRKLEEQMQESHDNGIALYPHAPDELWKNGNFVFTGHSSPPTLLARQSGYGELFATLPEIQIGDIIIVKDRFDNEYHYEITETDIVHPSQTSILKQGNDREITIMTCYPVGTTRNRFVAKGKPVGEVKNVAVR